MTISRGGRRGAKAAVRVAATPAPAAPAACYVYMHLPGTLDVVTCGRYSLDRQSDGSVVGHFVYGRRYREDPRAVALDDFHLSLKPGTFQTAGQGIFGALRDAAPDAWGRRIIEKRLGRAELTELEYLLAGPDDRAGALGFGLTPTAEVAPAAVHGLKALPRLLATADALLGSDGDLEELLDAGTSMGGARPKAVVEAGGALWLAKFPMAGDRWNHAAVEAGMLSLAAACGIRTPPTRVVKAGGRDVLLVRRFDREKVPGGYLRHRMVSALTVLGSDDDPLSRRDWSYPRLADELRRWVAHPDRDTGELFRRVTFNALISNLDDHPRNHALVAPGRAWELSPAYDLVPSPAVSDDKRDLALEVGRYNRYANRENLLSACARFRLSRDEAGAIVDRMKATVAATWRTHVRTAGGSAVDCAAIERAFCYPGFELDPRVVLG